MIHWEVQFNLFGLLIARQILVFYFPAEHLFGKESVSNESGVTNDTSPGPLPKVSLSFSISQFLFLFAYKFLQLCGITLSCISDFISSHMHLTDYSEAFVLLNVSNV